MKLILSSVLIILASATVVTATDPMGTPLFVHPVIKNYGGVVALPNADHQPRANAKVLLDITSDAKEGGVVKGLDRAALIVNQYALANVNLRSGLKLAVVLHGPATKAALSQEAYARHAKPYLKDLGKTTNPDLELIRQLKQAGVDVFVCGQALAHQGYSTDSVAPEVTISLSAATVNINLQNDGFAYIPFH
jgi:intracellular sulfur oxidation DsrE/DsrF family protein